MKKTLLIVSTTLLFAQVDPSISYTCDISNNKIVFDYAKTEEEVTTNEEENIWRLRDLRTIKQTDEKGYWEAWVENSRIVKRTCTTKNGIYNIEIGVTSGNPGNLYGRCGGWLTAWTKIKKNNTLIATEQFEVDCTTDSIIPTLEFDTTIDKVVNNKALKHDEYY